MNDIKDGPARFLVENISLLPEGRVLDVAMGRGLNAVYLAGLGFQVEGVDISPDAVSEALAFAKDQGIGIDARVVDLEKEPCISHDSYDVIICFRYLQRSLIPHIKAGLREGGIVVYETYTIDQERFGKPKNPDYLLKYNELLNMFRDFHCIRYHEGIFENNRAVAGIIARKTLKGGNLDG